MRQLKHVSVTIRRVRMLKRGLLALIMSRTPLHNFVLFEDKTQNGENQDH